MQFGLEIALCPNNHPADISYNQSEFCYVEVVYLFKYLRCRRGEINTFKKSSHTDNCYIIATIFPGMEINITTRMAVEGVHK